MADDEKVVEGNSSRGADWEVVSLTASTYAAAPGPKDVSTDDDSRKYLHKDEKESSGELFMSSHFVFPPSEHENLPIGPEFGEIHSESEGQEVSAAVDDYGDEPSKVYDKNVQGGPSADLQGDQFFEKGQSLSAHDLESKEVTYSPGSDSDEHDEPSDHNLESRKSAKHDEEDKLNGHGLPCEAWWKRHATCLYHHAKEANTFWSVVVAAALVGLVILGQRWQRDKWQCHQLKWRFSVSK
ncbi:ATG8-interacting protein 1 [Typha latifolia]|uniref:ATG8-interacting protein 1 n=1 Tax=Typha latifolia TaxID=4733 RepID=UPI003C30122B